MSLDEYLSEPCDTEGCTATATHNGHERGAEPPRRGQFCNQHMDWDQPAFARND